MRTLKAGLLRMMFWIFRQVSTRRRVEGLEVLLIGTPPNPDQCFTDVGKVLKRLQNDPRRWRLVCKYFRHIIISEYGGGSYIPGLPLCVVGTATLERGPLHAAGIIVHEMTHARLFTSGFTYTNDTRARHERICEREVYRFLNRTSETVAAAYAAHAAKCFAEDEPWYSERRRRQYGSQVMEFYGLPKWLQKLRRIFLD